MSYRFSAKQCALCHVWQHGTHIDQEKICDTCNSVRKFERERLIKLVEDLPPMGELSKGFISIEFLFALIRGEIK